MCGPKMVRKLPQRSSTFRQATHRIVHDFALFMIITMVVVYGGGVLAAQSFVEEPSNTDVMIGESVVILKCVVAEKSGNVLWFYGDNDQFIASDIDLTIRDRPRYSFVGNTSLGEYNLQIENVSLHDDGEYHCKVTGSESHPGIDSQRARLIIKRSPSITTMQPSNPILTVIAGIKTNLTCQATSANPVAEIKWLRAGSDISKTHQRVWSANDPSGKLMNVASTLTLSPGIADHSIVYECRISHMAMPTPRRHSITLDVQYAPVVVIEASESMPIREDTLIKLRCLINANPRRVSYTWTKNDEPILGAETNQIQIVITKEDHDTSITCRAENIIGSGSKSITTPVLYGPRFLEVPVSVSVDMEGPAQMSCSADGNPKPTIKWTRLGSRATLSTMHVLQFDLVRESDVGTYVCIATVPGFDPVMSYGRVDINAIPEISSPTEQKAKIGRKATLECFTDTKPDPYMVTWAWDDLEVEEGSVDRFTATKLEFNGGILSSLTIDGVKHSDFGIYNCTMRNDIGNASVLIELTQQDLDPIIWIIITVVGVAVGIFFLTIIVMIYCRRKWQKRKKASTNKGRVPLEIVRKLTEDDYDRKSGSDSYDYNATPPSTPGKPRYAEPYQYTRGRSNSFDDPYYRSPRRPSDSYSYDGRYPNNEYSEPIVRKREDDHTSYHSGQSDDDAPRRLSNSRYDDDMYDEEVKHYNINDPRYDADSRYDSRSYGNQSHDDSQYGDRRYDDDAYYHDDERSYGNKGSDVGSEVSVPAKNKLATNV